MKKIFFAAPETFFFLLFLALLGFQKHVKTIPIQDKTIIIDTLPNDQHELLRKLIPEIQASLAHVNIEDISKQIQESLQKIDWFQIQKEIKNSLVALKNSKVDSKLDSIFLRFNSKEFQHSIHEIMQKVGRELNNPEFQQKLKNLQRKEMPKIQEELNKIKIDLEKVQEEIKIKLKSQSEEYDAAFIPLQTGSPIIL